jgi:hypothetical protein
MIFVSLHMTSSDALHHNVMYHRQFPHRKVTYCVYELQSGYYMSMYMSLHGAETIHNHHFILQPTCSPTGHNAFALTQAYLYQNVSLTMENKTTKTNAHWHLRKIANDLSLKNLKSNSNPSYLYSSGL